MSKISCPDGSLVQAYLRGELLAADVDYVGSHLDSCRRCQESLHFLTLVPYLRTPAPVDRFVGEPMLRDLQEWAKVNGPSHAARLDQPKPVASALGHLKTSKWNLLQDWADRYATALDNDDQVDLADYLPPIDDPLRLVVLEELIKSDLEFRWRHGQRAKLDDYLSKFAELGNAPTLVPRLLYEEYRVRQRYGDKPELKTYRERFPKQFDQLQQFLQDQAPPTRSLAASTPRPIDSGVPMTVSSEQNVLPVGGGYKLMKVIGHGAFAEVWKAESPGGFAVGVKRVFRPIEHEEAHRELEALNRIKDLSHPFLLQTHAYHLHDDRLYVIMDLADGNLKDRLKQCQDTGLAGIPVSELVRYFEEAAEALDYMHSMHVIHRDIKPQNILLHKSHAKVADFGLARMLESQRHLVSASGSGTPVYMAPETFQNQVSKHSDQYSLAVSWVELRQGHRPFAGSDLMEVMRDHLERTPDLSSLPEAERAVTHKALAKRSDDRYPNCIEFVKALKQALPHEEQTPQTKQADPLPSSPPPPTDKAGHQIEGKPLMSRPSSWANRRRLLVGVTAILLLAGVSGLVVLIRNSGGTRDHTPDTTQLRPLAMYWHGFVQAERGGEELELKLKDGMTLYNREQYRLVLSASDDCYLYVAVAQRIVSPRRVRGCVNASFR